VTLRHSDELCSLNHEVAEADIQNSSINLHSIIVAYLFFVINYVSVMVCSVLCVLYCLCSSVCCVLFERGCYFCDVCHCLLCLTVVQLPSG
jgi:hypothetical protein